MLEVLKDKTDSNPEKVSLSRSVALGVTCFLSASFLIHVYMRGLTWELCIAYPVGVAIVYIPQLTLRLMDKANEFLKMWKGGDIQ